MRDPANTDKRLRIEPQASQAPDKIIEERTRVRRAKRENAAQLEYQSIRNEHPLWFGSILPNSIKSINFPSLKAILENDDEVLPETRLSLREALLADIRFLEPEVHRLVELYIRDLPPTWPRTERRQPLGVCDISSDRMKLVIASRLNLAVYVFRCGSPKVTSRPDERHDVHIGMEGLFHFCAGFEARPDARGHAIVLRILDLLGLSPGATTPHDLDRLDKRFVCRTFNHLPIQGPRPGQAMTWREVVQMASLTSAPLLGPDNPIPRIELLPPQELPREPILLYKFSEENRGAGYVSLAGMKAHLFIDGIWEGVEGQHYHYAQPAIRPGATTIQEIWM
ncbi:unnamed protein product [Peniophora sp. CBMAI 1063]|nr:unnamed protein product [Peniophora sp. CBMAI 1063]